MAKAFQDITCPSRGADQQVLIGPVGWFKAARLHAVEESDLSERWTRPYVKLRY